MFILRKINERGVQANICLDKTYHLITEFESEDFEKTINSKPYYLSEQHNIYAFIVYNEGAEVLPLFINQQNYIMTDNGSTFANVTYKK